MLAEKFIVSGSGVLQETPEVDLVVMIVCG